MNPIEPEYTEQESFLSSDKVSSYVQEMSHKTYSELKESVIGFFFFVICILVCIVSFYVCHICLFVVLIVSLLFCTCVPILRFPLGISVILLGFLTIFTSSTEISVNIH